MSVDSFLNQYFWIVVPLFWMVLTQFVARISGWRSLAEAYPSIADPTGPLLRFQSAGLRMGSNYGGILNVATDAQGISLSVVLLFRFGHPPVFVPWGDIQAEMVEGFSRGVRLRFSRKPNVPMVISRSLAERIAGMSMGRFRVPAR
jgi:hypothetical protein